MYAVFITLYKVVAIFDIFELEKMQIYNINTNWNHAGNKLHYLKTIQWSLLFPNKSTCCEIAQFYF